MSLSPNCLSKALLLRGAALSSLMAMLSFAPLSFAQTATEVTEEQATTLNTADDGDITITSTGLISTTDSPAVTLNSDNDVSIAGAISIEDTDNTTGVLIEGGNTGLFDLSGSISISEDFTPEDTDGDFVVDGTVASGTGRTGILISGGGAFTGNVTTQEGSQILVEGNDSAGIRLASGTDIDGDVSVASIMQVGGANSTAIDLAGDVSGNVDLSGGSILSNGEAARGIDITGDVGDRVTISSTTASSGFRFATRQNLFVRSLLDDEDTLQGGNAVRIAGDVGGGIHIANPTVTTDEGVTAVTGFARIQQSGSEAALLIGSTGAPINVGRIADITDPTDEAFDEGLQYSVVNEGFIIADGVLDDVDTVALQIQNAALSDGLSNEGTITSQTYRSGIAGDADDVSGDVAHSRAVLIASGADIPTFNNDGTITAAATEAFDTVFLDEANPEGANAVNATGLQIDAGATLTQFDNSGTLAAVLLGREGTAYALIDRSGTLATINNEGIIRASGNSSDPDTDNSGVATPDFSLVAIDVSANTTGVTLNNVIAVDDDTTDEITPASPIIAGNVVFGSGDDTFTSTDGLVVGVVSFGDGADTLALNSSSITGGLTDSDGDLTIALVDSSLTLLDTAPINATSASFDATSNFLPIIDGSTNTVSTLVASGNVTFEDGATITPLLANIIGNGGTFTLVSAGSLTLGTDIATLQPENAPWLYQTEITRSGNDLITTLVLRDTADLGLDEQQTAAFAGTFDALSRDASLGGAFAAITDEQEFNAAYNQLLPEFAAAVTQFVSANIDGSTGAVASHLNTTRRAEDERKGGAWIEEFAYFVDRDLAGLSEQYRGFGFGFTGGFDTNWGPLDTIGINFGFSTTEVEDVLGFDDPLNVQSFQTGLYAAYAIGQLGFDAYVGGGYSSFEQSRNIDIGSFNALAESDWNGTHYNASLNAGYDIYLGTTYFMRPSANVSYISLTEDSRVEDGSDAIRLAYEERTSEIGTATALLDFGGRFEGDRIWWSPTARIGVRNQFAGDGIITDASFVSSGIPLSLRSNDFPSTGLIFGASIAAGSKYSSFSLDYDADVRDGFNRHTLRLVLRMLF